MTHESLDDQRILSPENVAQIRRTGHFAGGEHALLATIEALYEAIDEDLAAQTECDTLRECIRMLLVNNCRYYGEVRTQGGRTYPAEWNQKHLPPDRRANERQATDAEREAISRALDGEHG